VAPTITMLKKTDAIFDKSGGGVKVNPPVAPKRTVVPPIMKYEVQAGLSWVLIVSKQKSAMKVTRYYNRPLPNGKWFRADKDLVQHLMGKTVTNNIWVLPLGMHPKDIGIEE